MKIQHVITSMGLNWGGPALTSLLTIRGLRALDMDATILTYEVQQGDRLIANDQSIICLPPLSSLSRWLGYSVAMKSAIEKTSADIYHMQGLWQYPHYAAIRRAQKRQVPYVITLHGQLYPQALALHSGRKRVALYLYQRKQLQEAACIHATCMEEYRYYRALGFTNPVAVITNPMDCSERIESVVQDSIFRVGYLGRIHSRKHVKRLIDVWHRLAVPEGELLIMGDGDAGYIRELKEDVKRLKLTNVRFTGFVSGEEKRRLVASLTCLAVPSDFENFGMIVPEALLQGVPVIASTGTPWEELNTHQCGWWVKNEVDTLQATLQEVLSLDTETRQAMGERGRKLIMENYSMDVVASRMKQLYDWVLGDGEKPNFVY